MVVVFFLFSDFAVFNNIEQYKTVEHEKMDDGTRYYCRTGIRCSCWRGVRLRRPFVGLCGERMIDESVHYCEYQDLNDYLRGKKR